MSDFDNVNISAWSECGVTFRARPRVRNIRRRVGNTNWKILFSAVTLAAAITGTTHISDDAISAESAFPRTDTAGLDKGNLPDMAPRAYWPKLIADMRDWKRLPEATGEQPDPLI